MDDVDLREGAVGGDLVNWTNDGLLAADMAVRVLNGEKPENIPVVKSTDAYTFDWRALKRWKLRESNLPSGSIVLHRERSFWDLYKQYVIGGIFLFLVGPHHCRTALAASPAEANRGRVSPLWRPAAHGDGIG